MKEGNTNWLQVLGYMDDSITVCYVNALYFSVTTMCTIGYGDLHPTNYAEYIVVIMLELVAGVTFASLISGIGNLFGIYNMQA